MKSLSYISTGSSGELSEKNNGLSANFYLSCCLRSCGIQLLNRGVNDTRSLGNETTCIIAHGSEDVTHWLYCTHYGCICIHLPIEAPQLPPRPVQLLNLQECAEVIYLKWPLLFLILTWFQKSQIIETILNINLVHLLCCIMSPCDSIYVTSLTCSDTPCCLHNTSGQGPMSSSFIDKMQWHGLLNENWEGNRSKPTCLPASQNRGVDLK